MKVPLLLANIQIVLLIRKLDHMAAEKNPEPYGAGSIHGFFFGSNFLAGSNFGGAVSEQRRCGSRFPAANASCLGMQLLHNPCPGSRDEDGDGWECIQPRHPPIVHSIIDENYIGDDVFENNYDDKKW